MLAIIFFAIVLQLTVVFATDSETCSQWLVTQDPDTQAISDEQIRQFAPRFDSPTFINQTICFMNETLIVRTLHIKLPVYTTTQNDNGQIIEIIPFPNVPVEGNEGEVDCVQIPCPGTFNSGTICWKCLERIQAPPDNGETGDSGPSPISSLLSRLHDTTKITPQAGYIRSGQTNCVESDENETVALDDEYTVDTPLLIGIAVAVFIVGCLLGAIIMLIIHKITCC